MVSYNKLWKLLIDKRMKKKDLAEAAGISANTIAKMGRDDLVSLEVLVRICRALKCDIGDIVEVIPLPDTDRESTEYKNI
ncbi:MAG: helix-turn-helix transcriptional regulator [Clostridiaceae bacterium]|nr:helix-turn-helix transcriptional regulator [Clostridiaceae bacterium]